MDATHLALVAAIGFAGSFYGVVSGGGGLLIIPGLIMAGMPAPAAVACSRLGVLSLSISGVWRFRREGLIRGRADLPLMAVVTAGSVVGALLLLVVDSAQFERAFGVVTILLAPLVLFGQRLRLESPGQAPGGTRIAVGYLLAFPVGIYAGLFGAAWATFFTYLMVAAFGMSYIQGAASRTFVGLAVGVITSLIVGLGGRLEAAPALVLMLATGAGSYLGASFWLKRGEGRVRQLVAVIAVGAGLKLLV